ncbi:MAG: TolC family protein [Candidatus Babeliales bacterium]
MRYNSLFLITFLLLLNGCTPLRIQKEYKRLECKAEQHVNLDLSFCQEQKTPVADPYSLTKKQAIAFALEYNKNLQAQLIDLGIAKADLVRAGFFTNPHLESVFKFPDSGNQANLEIVGTMKLSDFWQVPIRKNIAYDDLEIMTLSLIHTILHITVETNYAYNDCLFQEARLILITELYNKIKELRDRLIYRQKFGFQSYFDLHVANAMVGRWQAEVVNQQMMLQNSYIHLRQLLGLPITETFLNLSDTLIDSTYEIPSITALEEYGMQYRPELGIAFFNIEKAKDQLSLQKAKIIDNVNAGFTYERDFERAKGWGPALSFDIPIFDTKYAQIAKAKQEVKKAKKVYLAQKQMRMEEIYHAFNLFQAKQQEVIIYQETILPAQQKAIDYAAKYLNRMQSNMKLLLEAEITFYEAQLAKLAKQFELSQAYVSVQKSIGKLL